MSMTCKDCNKPVSSKKTIRCRKCHDKYRVGKNCYQYKGGKGDCEDCGQKLTQYTRKTNKCRECFLASQVGENHPQYEGLKQNCSNCNKEFNTYKSIKRVCCSYECMSQYKRGEKHHAYKGKLASTKINKRIRQLAEYKEWRMQVFQRDEFSCQSCGDKNTAGNYVYLQAHHIKPFAVIVKENNILNPESARMC